MGQSLSKLYVHIVFRVKSTFQQIKKDDRDELYSYIGSIIKQNDSIPIIINGVGDHVHILCVMSKNIALAKMVENINRPLKEEAQYLLDNIESKGSSENERKQI